MVVKKNFHEVSEKIFIKLNLKFENEWVALRILFTLRNTIHNNGHHVAKDKLYKYHNIEVNFINELPQNVAHFEILELILYDFKNLFIKIISNKI